MRTLLRDLDTGFFYKATSDWVQSAFEATDFADPESVRETALSLANRNLEIFVVDSAGKPIWGRRIEK
jgi:hypothetical protein